MVFVLFLPRSRKDNPNNIMKTKVLLFFLIAISGQSFAQTKIHENANKQSVIAFIDSRFDQLTELSDRIWAYGELAFQETKSSHDLAAYAEANGFTVARKVANIPTAFTAEYGSGRPIIGILGEFDALPGLSQKAVPHKEPLHESGAGHGCGHNLFGVASLGAAISIKELIEAGNLKGTIRFYGTPAEEKFFGKLWMIRAGLFDDADVVMDWHPAARTEAAVQSSLALVDFIVEFFGQAAHASGDPWNGRDASDALELYASGINYYREHVKPTVRMHYDIQKSGEVVNVVPDYSRLWVRVRDTKREGMNEVWKRVEKMAEGAAIMANVEHKITLVSGIHEILVNRTGGAKMQANLEFLGPILYTDEEQAFAKRIQEATSKEQVGMESIIEPLKETEDHPMGGSTDVGDVSFIVPVIRMKATTAPKDTPWHSWAVTACSGMSIGHKGMAYASKSLAMTMVDLFEDPKLVKQVRKEFEERKGDYVYTPMIPDGPPPIHAKHERGEHDH